MTAIARSGVRLRERRQAALFPAIGWVGVVIVATFVGLALAAPWLTSYRTTQLAGNPLQAPTGAHLLGTNGVGQDVFTQLLHGARVSLFVAVLAGGGTLIIGAAVGMVAGWAGGLTDAVLMRIVDLVLVVPKVPLLIVFAVILPIFPLAGARTPFAEHGTVAGVLDVAKHLVLPAGALTLSLLGTKFLFVRNTMVSALGADYMVLARAKGLPDRMLKYRHAGRNALLPFLTVVGIQVGFAVGGAVFVESVFAYPGMGSLILEAVEARDYPVLEATFLVLALVVLAVNLALELVYARIDPRVGAE